MIQYAQGDINDFISTAGNMAFPAYVIRGSSRTLMVDAGVNLLGPLYIESLNRIIGGSESLDYLFLTHSHYDHVGSMPYLKRKIPNLKTGGHERISQLMSKKSVLDHMNLLGGSYADAFGHIPGNEDVSISASTLDIHLQDGDIIDLGGITCRVIATPGHTRDSVSYFIPEARALFCGEALGIPEGENGSYIQAEFVSSYYEYLASIENLISLEPEIIGLGHVWVFTGDDARRYMEDSYRATGEFKDLIGQYLDRASGDVGSAIELMMVNEYDKKGIIKQERNAYLANLSAQVRLVSEMRNM